MNSFDLLDDFFEPIIVANPNDEIVYFNSSFLTLFKTTPRLIKKNKDLKNYLSAVVPGFTQLYLDLKNGNQVLSSELSFVIEEQICTVVIKGIRKESGDLIFLFKDMTVEKQLNDKYRAQLEELKNTHSQIIQSDKLKVIGEMTANISHEINNPLTVAMGNAELIEFSLANKDLNKERAAIGEYNANINHSLERIKGIITNMKEFLHKSEDKKEYCDAKEIVERAIAFTRHSIKGTDIEVKIKLEGEPPLLLVNKTKMEQVFVNLIQNAIDSLKTSGVKNPIIEITLKTDVGGNFVLIDVKDNGKGIAPENRSQIFNTFFTTKGIGEGTGLGLSISNRIVQSHQGKLELLESPIGAHFLISLPAIGIASYVGNWEKLVSNTNKLIKVLVVDNEVNILNLCMNFLADSEYHFLGASCAEEAFALLERTDVDLIITDLQMPSIDGEKFIRELRGKNVKVPVFFMTSKDYVDKYKALKNELGLSGIIIKPFTKEELVGAIGVVTNE